MEHDVILATKVRFRRGDGPNDIGLSRAHIIREVENSLRRLQTGTIDLYYAHMWDPIVPIEETLRAFDDLVTAGKVRYIGASNFKAWQLMKALSVSQAKGYARFVEMRPRLEAGGLRVEVLAGVGDPGEVGGVVDGRRATPRRM